MNCVLSFPVRPEIDILFEFNKNTIILPHSNDHAYNSIQTGLLCLDVERFIRYFKLFRAG